MRFTNIIAALLLATTTTACVTSVNAPATTDLVGGVWLVEDIASRGVIDNARTTISFGSDGRLTGDTACNRYFADYEVSGDMLEIGNAGTTKRACVPAVMDQEQRFLEVLGAVDSYTIDATRALILSTPQGQRIVARKTSNGTERMTYQCSDGATVTASYPTTETATIAHQGRTVEMELATSASGARYVGGGLQWWTKGISEGILAPLAEGESIASARGLTCTR